ncbi:dapper homolog 1 isoform X2 [Phyllopteryx taeniolatus]|nr:dapper homolog 1 isoform X2 [Phyllopteryx taeniolatus]XP_061650374.1 dapper homolog 1 isoform X2 [Phyllopteryx taeniolatus]XP_061650375.1 dapper homolog 1 isoform X2 [Phyllopteryx taeniolatus]XP_061650376.1 dapper homolog 1 isoform X2 [Phyllopteryx taeniolatus]XP_061650377.1 dapper homolog 1 isoform X2 [Phyllopteryx taeniolatus]
METSHAQQEADSQASSGFYELSDAASSSNSSNSILGECFRWTADPDGFRPADDEAGCSTCDSSSPSSALNSPSSPSKPRCNVLVPKMSEAVRPPGPATVGAPWNRSRVSLQALIASKESATPATYPPIVRQSCSWPAHRHSDSYISRLLRRRAPPARAVCPGTNAGCGPDWQGRGDGTRRHPLPATQVSHTKHVDLSQGGIKVPGPNAKMAATHKRTLEPAALTRSHPNPDQTARREQSQRRHRKHAAPKSRHSDGGRIKSRMRGLEDTGAAPLTACGRAKRPPRVSTPDVHRRGNCHRRHITRSERDRHRPSRAGRDAFACTRTVEPAREQVTGSDPEYSAECSSGRAAAGVTGERRCDEDAARGPSLQAFVKIKASHRLKRKILRFRSGSLRLMTTV